jgi:hypothetical protein
LTESFSGQELVKAAGVTDDEIVDTVVTTTDQTGRAVFLGIS